MAQQHKQGTKRDKDDEVVQEQPQGAETKPGLDDDIDDILAEIDDVLEVEAEAFVKNFIQKGGE